MTVFEEIKSRLLLSDIVRQKVQLQSKGHYWMGLCPFHQEKTPSFMVSDVRGRYYCFGCGSHGDVFDFVANTTSCTNHDALLQLARMANVTLDSDFSVNAEKHRSYHRLMSAVQEYFRNNFSRSTSAKKYARSRGLGEEVWERLQLGYAPSGREHCLSYLKDRGFSADQILSSGLVSVQSNRDNLVFLFGHRLMFPIFDRHERIVGFGGRSLNSAQSVKYINSSENEHFKKKELLYNLPMAREASKRHELIVVEGYMDVAALVQHGIERCVGVLGTALGERQMELLWQMADVPCICFDGDAAGRRAMFALMKRVLGILRLEKSLSFVELPANEDPDSILRTSGLQAFGNMVHNSLSLLQVMKMYIMDQMDASPSSAKNRYLHCQYHIRNLTDLIADGDVRAYYVNKITSMFRMESTRSLSGSDGHVHNVDLLRSEKTMMAFLLYHPNLCAKDEDFILSLEFSTTFLNVILQAMVEIWERLVSERCNFSSLLNYLLWVFQHRGLYVPVYKKSYDWLQSIDGTDFRRTYPWTSWTDDEHQNEIDSWWKSAKVLKERYHRKL